MSADIQQELSRLQPINQQLARMVQAKSLVSVPLKLKNKIIGSITVDRGRDHALTQDDVNVMMTLASQVAIALDNTEAYRQIEQLNIGLEDKVRERTAELERADQHRTLFLSHVSHELRTPLTAIKGFLENMLGGVTGPLSEKQDVYLRRMSVNADRLVRMIGDLLDRTRLETGHLELRLEELDLHHAVSEAVDQLRPLASEKRQRLIVLEPEAPAAVQADADRVAQIVTNLVQNAIKYTPEGGEIVVGVVNDSPQFAALFVKDTGPGIPPDALERIFDPFFRIGTSARGSQKGLGLGLSIVKSLVEQHGGAISVSSKVGHGTEFYVRLPRARQISPERPKRSRGPKHILVVDDDADIRELLTDRLGAAGYAVTTAADGPSAVAAFCGGTFDGVLLDIGLPELDGIDVLKRIRQKNQTVPVIIVTASGSKERALKALAFGAQDYLLKPFESSVLQEIVERWVGAVDAEVGGL